MKVIAFANQKGGVGKTTATYNMAVALTNGGKKVLCIDLDPQHNLSTYMGYTDPQPTDVTTMDLLQMAIRCGNANELILSAIRRNSEGVCFIPSNIQLSGADMVLAGAFMREQAMRNVLRSGYLNDFDYILIDCLPSLSILLTNALVAADSVIIPVQAKKFALDGLDLLESAIQMVMPANPTLHIEAVLVNMTKRTKNSDYVEQQLRERYGDKVLKTTIPDLNEADTSTFMGVSLVNAAGSRLGRCYKLAAAELLRMEG